MIDPSALDWWQWLLLGVGAVFAAGVTYGISFVVTSKLKSEPGFLTYTVMLITGLYSALCFCLAFIRFIKWAWNA